MKKPIKRCPSCGSTKIVVTEDSLKCSNCGFINDKQKEAQFVTYDRKE